MAEATEQDSGLAAVVDGHAGILAELREVLGRHEDVIAEQGKAVDGLAKDVEEAREAKPSGGSVDGDYLSMIEDKIAVLEWALEHQQGVNLTQARKAVLGPAEATAAPAEGETPPATG